MGSTSDPLTVVDPELKLVGFSNCRVVDASVFPLMVTANPMVTVFIVAEKAADMILADYYKSADRARAQQSRL